MDLQMVPAQIPAQTARAELVAVLQELHDVLLKIGMEEIDRRYVDFEAMAKRLEECIEKVEELGQGKREKAAATS